MVARSQKRKWPGAKRGQTTLGCTILAQTIDSCSARSLLARSPSWLSTFTATVPPRHVPDQAATACAQCLCLIWHVHVRFPGLQILASRFLLHVTVPITHSCMA